MKLSPRALKSAILLFFLAITIIQPSSGGGGSWMINASIPASREGGAFRAINAVFYAAGEAFNWNYLTALKTYDPVISQSDAKGPMSKPLFSPNDDSESDQEIVDPSETVAGSSIVAADEERFYAIPEGRSPPRVPFPPPLQPPQCNDDNI